MAETLPKVMVCLDFSRCGRGALEAGASLARDMGAELLLVHVLPPHVSAPVYEGDDVQRMFREAAARADEKELLALTVEWAERARAWDVPVRPVALTGPPASSILELVEQERPAVVVVGRLGTTGFRRWVLGSVAEEVARRSPVPVLVVPASEDDG